MVRYYALKLAAGTQFEDAVREAKTAILDHGFGIVADIDIAATLKEKTGRDIGAYRILGACKPATAEQALRLEPAIGVLLPCNVVVRQNGGEVEVLTADPLSLGGFAGNSALEALGLSIREQMQSILESVADAARSNAAGSLHLHGEPHTDVNDKLDEHFKSFSQRLAALTDRFHKTGSLAADTGEVAQVLQRSDLNELEQDISALNGNFRHIVSYLDSRQCKSYAIRHLG